MSLKLGLRNKIRRSRAAGGFVGLLDQPFAQGATAAYSLRLLREKHSGGLVRVRADDGGTDKGEADVLPRLQPDGSKIIELNSPIENLNSKAQNRLGAPAGGGDKVLADLVDANGQNFDGFVTKWYDQSGNSNDATQSGASQQPKIVDSGSVIQKKGKPALEFDGSDDFLDNASVSSPQPNQFFNVFALKTLNKRNDIRGSRKQPRSTRNLLLSLNGSFQIFADALLDSGVTEDKKQHLITDLYNGSNSVIRFDGSQVKTGDAGQENLTGLRIGANDELANFANANIQEIIFYSSDQSSNQTKIENNINNHYSIF